MTPIIVTRRVKASPDIVFRTVADIREFARVLPHVVSYEFLTEQKSGVGTRFRETRLMQGKEASTELEVTEYDPPERVRLVADSHGTVWDTVFSVASEGDEAVLTMTMDARSYQWLPWIMNRLIKGMITKAVERDLDLVMEFCESSGD